MEINDSKSVYRVMANILSELVYLLDTPYGKAVLANLRKSIGKPITQTVDIWAFVFEKMPENFLSKNGEPTREEKAIITTLQLYALHKQGLNENVNDMTAEKRYENIGTALKNLRHEDDKKAIDRRFNTMITSCEFSEITYYLRQMIKILKSRSNCKINYAKLAEDLSNLQDKYKFEKVRFNWAQSYYSNKGEENE